MKWRGATLSEFDGKRWTNPSRKPEMIPVENDHVVLAPPGLPPPGRRINYRVEMEEQENDTLFFAGTPETLDLQARALYRSEGSSFRLGHAVPQGFHYDAYSLLDEPPETAPVPFPPPVLPLAARELYLRLPRARPPRRRTGTQLRRGRDRRSGTRAGDRAASALRLRVHPGIARSRGGRSAGQLPVRPPQGTLRVLRQCHGGDAALAGDSGAAGDRLSKRRVQSGLRPVAGARERRAQLGGGLDSGLWLEDLRPHAGRSERRRIGVIHEAGAVPGCGRHLLAGVGGDLRPVAPGQPGVPHGTGALNGWAFGGSTPRCRCARRGTGMWPGERAAFGWRAVAFAAGLVALGLAAGPLVRLMHMRRRVERVRRGQASVADATLLYQRMLQILRRRGFHKPPWFTPAEFAASLPRTQLGDSVGEFTATYNALRFGGHVEAASQAVDSAGPDGAGVGPGPRQAALGGRRPAVSARCFSRWLQAAIWSGSGELPARAPSTLATISRRSSSRLVFCGPAAGPLLSGSAAKRGGLGWEKGWHKRHNWLIGHSTRIVNVIRLNRRYGHRAL